MELFLDLAESKMGVKKKKAKRPFILLYIKV